MQFNMNLGKKPVVAQSKAADDLIRQRIQEANASLKRQLTNAQRQRDQAMHNNAVSESQLVFVKAELSKARQMISELEKKVKETTAALAEAVSRKSRKEKKQEVQGNKAENTDNTGNTGNTSNADS